MSALATRNVGDVVAEILMTRSAFSGTLLVVEGGSDIAFWKTRVGSRAECQFVLAGGKPIVVGAVVRCDEVGCHGVVGIVDDDYDSMVGVPSVSVNIIRTECCDLEAVLLRSPALGAVLAEVGDGRKIFDLKQREGCAVLDSVVSRSAPFGRLRLLSRRHGWNLSFDNLNPYRFIDQHTWAVDLDALNATAAREAGVSLEDVQAHLNDVLDLNAGRVVHGKDSLKILAIGLKAKLGDQQHPIDRLASMLRMAFTRSMLEACEIYANIRDWERRNSPFQVLPP